MFGIFKNLFKKTGPESSPAPMETAKPVTPVAKPVSAPPVTKPVAAAPKPAAPAPAPAKVPAPVSGPATAPAPQPAAPRSVSAGDSLEIPLSAIMAKLPDKLKGKVANQNGTVTLSKAQAAQQLATGAVKYSFGELRRMATPGALLAAGDLEQIQVELPLSEIIPHLGAQSFSKRGGQKTIDIPDEVGGLFGVHGQPAASTKGAVSGLPTTGKSAAAAPAPSAPAPVAAPIQPPAAKVPAAPAPPQPAAPAAPLKVTSDLLSQMSAAAGAKPSAPAAPAPTPAGPAGMVAFPVVGVSAAWPDELKEDIKKLGLSGAILMVPVAEMERALKTGKVSFAWKQLLAWSNPALNSTQGEVVVDLPLKVVAPLFLAANKPVSQQKKVQIDPSIPDMFAGKMGGAAPAAEAAPAPAPAPTPAPIPAPKPMPMPAAVAVASPMEAVQRAMKLAGVAGAVIASEDGLPVAAQLPAALKADNVAAFLPQVFNRLGQATKDFGAGPLDHLSFSCGASHWSVNKCGKVFLAVVSQPQRALPMAEIHVLGRELAKL